MPTAPMTSERLPSRLSSAVGRAMQRGFVEVCVGVRHYFSPMADAGGGLATLQALQLGGRHVAFGRGVAQLQRAHVRGDPPAIRRRELQRGSRASRRSRCVITSTK